MNASAIPILPVVRQHALSEPDESRLSLVWRSSAVALRPYIGWMNYKACPLELSGEIFRPERRYKSIV
jgi:hypothetical protein